VRRTAGRKNEQEIRRGFSFRSRGGFGRELVIVRALKNNSQQPVAVATTSKIAVAAKDLDVGAVIKEDDVKLEDWTGPFPEGSTSRPQELVGAAS